MSDLKKQEAVVQPIERETFVGQAVGGLPIFYELDGERNWNLQMMMRAEMNMLLARGLHHRGQHREAFRCAVMASQELFTAIGTNRETQEPLKHLAAALQDLDAGRLDKALDPGTVHNRKVEASSEWEARAAMCLALEARMARGERETVAAEAVRQKIAVVPGLPTSDRATPIRRLIEWRKQFRSKNRRPPFGDVVWYTGNEILIATCTISEEWRRDEQLLRIEGILYEQAERYRSRMTPGEIRSPCSRRGG